MKEIDEIDAESVVYDILADQLQEEINQVSETESITAYVVHDDAETPQSGATPSESSTSIREYVE